MKKLTTILISSLAATALSFSVHAEDLDDVSMKMTEISGDQQGKRKLKKPLIKRKINLDKIKARIDKIEDPALREKKLERLEKIQEKRLKKEKRKLTPEQIKARINNIEDPELKQKKLTHFNKMQEKKALLKERKMNKDAFKSKEKRLEKKPKGEKKKLRELKVKKAS